MAAIYGDSDCKGCSESIRVSGASRERMAADFRAANPELCIAEVDYRERLEICSSCEDLRYSSTCSHCGCLVHLRALIKDKACPAPSNPRW